MIDWLKPALEIAKFVLQKTWLTPKEKAARAWDKVYSKTKEYLKQRREGDLNEK